jgi:acyl carrier protein
MDKKLQPTLIALVKKLNKGTAEITPSTDLFEAGVLDSLTLIELVVSIEQEFKISLKYNDIQHAHFRTVEELEKLLVSRYQL